MKVSTKNTSHEQVEKVRTIREANFAMDLIESKASSDGMFCQFGRPEFCQFHGHAQEQHRRRWGDTFGKWFENGRITWFNVVGYSDWRARISCQSREGDPSRQFKPKKHWKPDRNAVTEWHQTWHGQLSKRRVKAFTIKEELSRRARGNKATIFGHLCITSLSIGLFSCSQPQASTAVEILQFIQPWYESEEFGSVMAVTGETSWFGQGPLAESFEALRIRRRNFQHVRCSAEIFPIDSRESRHPDKDTCKAGAANWLVHIFEWNKDCGFKKYQTQNRAMVNQRKWLRWFR